MKKRSILVLLMAVTMVVSGISGVFANSSINPGSVTPSTPGQSSTDYEGVKIIGTNTGSYESSVLAGLINRINNGEVISPEQMVTEVPQSEGKQNAEEFPTDNGFNVNLKLYDTLVGPNDIVYSKGGSNSYEYKKENVKVECPELIGHDGTDLLVVVFDYKTGEMHVIAPTAFNSALGMLTFDLPCCGPFFVLQKLPIVVRNVDTDKYVDSTVAKEIKGLATDQYLELSDFLAAVGVDGDKLKVAKGKNVKVADYSAATYLGDIALRTGENSFSYNLTTKLNARLFRDIDKVDYERILDYAGVDYDKDAVKKDKDKLADIEPFVLKKSFVYQIDAATGKAHIIYEPEISFSDYDDEEEAAAEAAEIAKAAEDSGDKEVTEAAETALTSVDQDKIKVWDVEDIDSANEDGVCICINGDKYIGMGPFALFMPKSSSSFPWWIILIIVVACGLIGYIIYRNKKNAGSKNA